MFVYVKANIYNMYYLPQIHFCLTFC